MKGIWTRELVSDRVIDGWIGLVLGIGLFLFGVLGMVIGLRPVAVVVVMVFGVLCVLSGREMLAGRRRGYLLGFWLCLVFAAFVVCWGWEGPYSLLKGVVPLLVGWGFYARYTEQARLAEQ